MPTNNLKILLVEDDPFARSMLEVILTTEGYNVTLAENGSEALGIYYSESDIDIIVSDMNMPEMDGLELIRTLRDREEVVPVIILTSNREIKVAVKTIYSGASAYLLKDENIEDTFIPSIRKTWEHHMLEKEKQQLLKDLERKNKELERLSYLDPLTGISNRRYFDVVMGQEWRRVTREKVPISIIMIDIDYFKLYNDFYGHQEGDRCLKLVAKALGDALMRPGDFVARYGGEEFIGVLPNSPLRGAREVAGRMQINIEELEILHEKSDISDYVTVSIGIACAFPEQNSILSELIMQADKALYSAKNNGRNRIHSNKDLKRSQVSQNSGSEAIKFSMELNSESAVL
ncbi:Response regulator receiver modulated diguanylate cyclase [Desulfamplus magnetovallimortis]|uniref:diguanylate cyclase n=1 Tax=Desulfamplus magnetovallimortis TaxID=1246637 RepID=A0A1W1HIE8_9BACT|nr:diguanylate cyclase [Desulfamplus magnetovallimortis]SLM32277.1 Response regulator receiver modulated diguanylate cyclase [Desulfamplus magnetovallimortis]